MRVCFLPLQFLPFIQTLFFFFFIRLIVIVVIQVVATALLSSSPARGEDAKEESNERDGAYTGAAVSHFEPTDEEMFAAARLFTVN